MKADFHVHTNRSPDGRIPPNILERVAVKKGIDVVAITDHNRLTVIKGEKVVFVPGEEVKTTKGEIIGLGLTEEIPKGLEPGEVVDRIREQGGVVVIPHPFDRARGRSALFLHVNPSTIYFDAIEVINARYIRWTYVEEAKRFVERFGVPGLGASDAHTVWELGRAYTEIPPVEDVEDVLNHIRRGNVQYRGKLSSPLVHMFSFIHKVTTKLW